MSSDLDFALALSLQEQFDQELLPHPSPRSSTVAAPRVPRSREPGRSVVDEHWELVDPTPNVHQLFVEFDDMFFEGALVGGGVEVRWSQKMTLCAGVCVYEGRGGLCSVRLSQPLLKLRPRKDLVETLLHEMIHAYLFVTENNTDHAGHGPNFHMHMHRINRASGANISVYHSFHDEVAEYRGHWWRCNGPCQHRKPFFGYVKRAMNRAPSPRDRWWPEHHHSCGGTFLKIKEPDGYGGIRKAKGKDGEPAGPRNHGSKFEKTETKGKIWTVDDLFSVGTGSPSEDSVYSKSKTQSGTLFEGGGGHKVGGGSGGQLGSTGAGPSTGRGGGGRGGGGGGRGGGGGTGVGRGGGRGGGGGGGKREKLLAAAEKRQHLNDRRGRPTLKRKGSTGSKAATVNGNCDIRLFVSGDSKSHGTLSELEVPTPKRPKKTSSDDVILSSDDVILSSDDVILDLTSPTRSQGHSEKHSRSKTIIDLSATTTEDVRSVSPISVVDSDEDVAVVDVESESSEREMRTCPVCAQSNIPVNIINAHIALCLDEEELEPSD